MTTELRPKTTAELLTAAFNLFEGGIKWTKRAFVSLTNHKGGKPGGNCFCALGAIRELKGPDSNIKYSAETYLLKALRNMGKAPRATTYMAVPSFNDCPETTFDDIRNLFNEAIELAQKEGN